MESDGSGVHIASNMLFTVILVASYRAGETVTVRWNCGSSTCTSTTLLGKATTNSHGQFSGLSITIPTSAKLGATPIGGKGGTSGGFAQATFTVVAAASTPHSGFAGRPHEMLV